MQTWRPVIDIRHSEMTKFADFFPDGMKFDENQDTHRYSVPRGGSVFILPSPR